MREISDDELTHGLIALLQMEDLGNDVFRGPMEKRQRRRIFGGQIIGQALMAAGHTCGRLPHSLHAYFIRPGNPTIPVDYEVIRVRDGGSFSSRRVIARQEGMEIFNMAASFHGEESGFEHQTPMPILPNPEAIPTREARNKANLKQFPQALHEFVTRKLPIDIRFVENADTPKNCENYWFRIRSTLPDNQLLQRAIFAFASDFTLIEAALRPHAKRWYDENIQVASLDHAIWFHGDIKFDKWHAYVQQSPWAGGGRGIAQGLVYTQNGKLVASVIQEGLMRNKA